MDFLSFLRVTEHVDFESTLENTSLKPYCPANIPESAKTFPNLAVSLSVEIGH